MLKCPACHERVLGADLVTGVCSHCGKDLTSSAGSSLLLPPVSGEPTSDTIDPMTISGVVPSEPSVAGPEQTMVFGQPGGGGDSSFLGTVDLRKAGLKVGSSDSGETSVPRSPESRIQTQAASAASESAQTFISDEFQDMSGDVYKTMQAPLSYDDEKIGSDTVMDSAVQEASIEFTSRTMISDGSESLVDKESDKTVFISDEPESLYKTVVSVWGDAVDDSGAHPGMTFKKDDIHSADTRAQSLIIKTKDLVESEELKGIKQRSANRGEAEYELIRVLGEGGMGIVYDARQTSINRNVALKMIKGDPAKAEKQNAKFLAEAVVTGDLDHPNIVPIYDVGANSQGNLFYSMKKVHGTPWMKAIRDKSLSENLEILMRTADAIGFAHARGIVHRDLKPENIMLGEFGEVLVMDWGLAHPLKNFQKKSSITTAPSMGGTPAYMAPELATGPIEKIGPAVDIYLLGAMLYEILTTKPPHVASTAMKCLVAAARNEIAPTDKTGELMDIAMKAMATEPKDRYRDVKEFQAAIREYQSHTESVLLSTRAEDDLKIAHSSDDYQQFARALFGFQEAFELWSGNKRAATGVSEAKLAYASSAMKKGDLDLGLSLLDKSDENHAKLILELTEARNERDAKMQRLAMLRRAAIGLVATVFVTVTGAAVWIRSEQQKAIAEAARASTAEKVALSEKEKAEAAEVVALNEKAKAEAAYKAEEKSKLLAIAAEKEAVAQQQKAEEAKRKEEYEAYISKIGLAASQTEKNAFDAAREVLASCKPELRNWEWGRLMHLCSQSLRAFDAKSPLESLAIAKDGKRFATGGWGGMARLWDRETGEMLKALKHGGEYVNAVTLSPDGRFLATGSNSPEGFIQIWDLETGQRVKVIKGHDDEVLSLSYSRDGKRLLSSSYDKTARLWDANSGQELKRFVGHTWWVWSAAFSTDEQRIVTASQDGTAIVWDLSNEKRSSPFIGHRGPVFAAVFSPDGKQVVSAGYDHRILAWNPADVKSFDFARIIENQPLQNTPFREFGGHTDAVRSVGFSTDGSLLLSSSQDNTVRVWDFQTAQTIKSFRGHGGRVKFAAFLPDGQGILSASEDNSVREWGIADYEEIRTLQGRQLDGHMDAVLSAAYSQDQSHIITASRDRTARTWNTRTGEPQLTFSEGHSYLASTAVFFPTGRRLLTSAVDNTARIWNVETGGQLLRIDHTGRSAAAAISTDGNWIATGGDDKSVQVFAAETGQRVKRFEGHNTEVSAVAFSPDGRLLASGDARGHVKLWNIEEGQIVASLDGHTRRISAISFSEDGTRLLTASGDKTVGQWHVATGKEIPELILKHPDSVLTMRAVPSSSLVVTSCADKKLRVWDAEKVRIEKTIGPLDGDCFSLSVSADGRRLIAANAEDRTVRLWELESGREILFPKPGGKLGPLVDLKLHGGVLWSVTFLPGTDDVLTMGGTDARLWDVKAGREKMSFSQHGAVASASFSPDGQLVVTGSWDNSAKVWDAQTGRVVRKLAGGHHGFVNTAKFSPNGKYVLTASDDGTAKLWDHQTGEVVKTFEGHASRVRSAEFSSRGDLVLTTSNDKTAGLWDVETGKLIREFKGHDWGVTCGEFSKNGEMIVTGSEDNTARVWDVATGETLLTLSGHSASVTSVAFSPDAARVLTGSQDQTAKLWDARTGKEILTLSHHTDEVTSVAFSPDGRQVLTGSRDGTANIWLSQKWDAQKDVAAKPK